MKLKKTGIVYLTLALATIVVIGFVVLRPHHSVAVQAVSPQVVSTPTDYTTYETQVVAEINTAREQHGLNDLQIDNRLTAFAYARNHDMYARNYYGHHDPKTGANMLDGITAYYPASHYQAEVVTGGVATGAVDNWLTSTEGHREILLDPYYTHIGFAYSTNHLTSRLYDTEYHQTEYITGIDTAELSQE